MAGLGAGATSADLKAFASILEAQERSALQAQMAAFDQQYAALSERAKAAKVSPAFSPAPGSSFALGGGNGGLASPTPAESVSGQATTTQILQEIEQMKADILQLKRIIVSHDKRLEGIAPRPAGN
jgi:hypothetical protein